MGAETADGNIGLVGPVRKRPGSLLTIGYRWASKYERAIPDSHRQIQGLVYNSASGSNLKSHPTEEVSYGNSGASC
jgi:hypothetical protein